MRNGEIADALSDLATLYELDGANRFRVLAYRDAAKVIRDSPVPVGELAREGTATKLQGVGDTMQQKIVALLDEGEIPSATKLKRKYPVTLVEVTQIPGLGAKTTRRLFEELGVATLDDLRDAAEEQKIRSLKGLGAKVEENVLAELDRIGDEGPSQRLLLSEVLPIAQQLATALRQHPTAVQVEVAGSARRGAETCKDIDLIATARNPAELAQALAEHPLSADAGNPGEAGVKITTHNGIPVDLRIVQPSAFGNLLQHFTGSADHNVALRELAQRKGLSVSEHGILNSETGKVTRNKTEAAVYKRLGLSYIEPELREGTGEIAAAMDGSLPDLVGIDDVCGDLHCHTTLSDGLNSLEEMVSAAKARGYAYVAITDHSASHGFGNDVTPDALRRRIDEVKALDRKLRGFKVVAGSEVNILPNGSLDYSDDLLAELDWVIASVHTSFRMGRKRLTQRFLTAMEHPSVHCIGHLTGRQILTREPYDLDVEQIVQKAAETGTMLEINGNPRRRDLSEQHARLAAEAGVRIVLNTDAHRVETLANMKYAVTTARRAWLSPEQIVNTGTWRSVSRLRKQPSG
ncbi:MAG: DNA polymerase/3'-5' exonuclease PolX [Solirubrobacterales bacterium]